MLWAWHHSRLCTCIAGGVTDPGLLAPGLLSHKFWLMPCHLPCTLKGILRLPQVGIAQPNSVGLESSDVLYVLHVGTSTEHG